MIEESVEEIEEACPDITDETLLNDVQAVQASLPEVQNIFSTRGFDSSEAEQATIKGWKQLRIQRLESTSALSPKELITFVSGFGKLVIKSSPSAAIIEIDGKALANKTDHVRWDTPGSYRLRLTLDGYVAVEDKCVVEEGKATLFERTLQPLKKPDPKKGRTKRRKRG